MSSTEEVEIDGGDYGHNEEAGAKMVAYTALLDQKGCSKPSK